MANPTDRDGEDALKIVESLLSLLTLNRGVDNGLLLVNEFGIQEVFLEGSVAIGIGMVELRENLLEELQIVVTGWGDRHELSPG